MKITNLWSFVDLSEFSNDIATRFNLMWSSWQLVYSLPEKFKNTIYADAFFQDLNEFL